MKFLHPALAWWFAAAAVLLLVLRFARRRPLAMPTTASWLFTPAYRASILRRIPLAVFTVALALVGVASMQPVLPLTEADVRSHGLDIVIALDLSSSMGERMGKNAAGADAAGTGPFRTRLDATKSVISAFISRRLDDRIGLVVFSDNAYVISPLTFDHQYLQQYLAMVDDQILRGEGMTAIGEGLALSNRLLSRQAAVPGAHNKVVVVFTDGENNIGREPVDVLSESDSAGIRVHLVGVDLEQEMKSKPAVKALVRALTGYGGRYFSADTARALDAASRAIDATEKGVLVRRTYQRDAPVFEWFAVPAMIALALGFLLRAIPPFIDQT